MPELILAIDQGTTGTTVFVIDPRGTIRGRSYGEIRQFYPRPGWVEHDPEEHYFTLQDEHADAFRRMAVFDVVINNTDRKGGHLLPAVGGHLYAVDHGVTFSVVPKLRTILWAWEGQPFDAAEVSALQSLAESLGSDGQLHITLRGLLLAREVAATNRRVEGLLAARTFPGPSPDWPAIPWPPF